MTDAIDITDRRTWPELMTVQHIAAIWSLSTKTVNRLVSEGKFVPAPDDGHPRRWRKDDVIRWYERRELARRRRA